VAEHLRELAARRVLREPMAYILGEREFWGLPFKVSPPCWCRGPTAKR